MYKLPCRCFRLISTTVIILHLPISLLIWNHVKHSVVEIPLIQLFKSKPTEHRKLLHMGPIFKFTCSEILNSHSRQWLSHFDSYISNITLVCCDVDVVGEPIYICYVVYFSYVYSVCSNQINRFAKAPHHQSSGAPNIMTSNRDKNKHTK